MTTALNLLHSRITYTLIELAIPIRHLNMLAIALIDVLVGARGTVCTNRADSAVCNVGATAVLIFLELVLAMMSTESSVVVQVKIIGVTLDHSPNFNIHVDGIVKAWDPGFSVT